VHELGGFGQGKGKAGPVIGRPSADLGRNWTTVRVPAGISADRRPMPPVDPDRLRSLRDDYGDLATELLGLFETSAAATLDELRAALAARDGAEVRRLAHRLKGSARNVGATGMAELATELEQVPPEAAATLGRLEAALAPTCARLRETLETS
jgi:HPt (histidine-containing phosphotransfer) domain-containing protein